MPEENHDDQDAQDKAAGEGGDGTADQADQSKTGGDDVATLTKTLLAERKARRDAEAKLEEREKAAMTEQERAVATAREEGRSEAVTAAGRRLAAAEFRAAAAGKLPNVDAFLEVMDPSKFIGEDGEPDRAAINATIAKMAAKDNNDDNDNGKLPPHLSFPGGVRQPAANADTDWLREAASR